MPLVPLVRARTPDEAFGGPRPKLDPLLVEVLDGRWKRQLELKSLWFVLKESHTERLGDGRILQNSAPWISAWDERWGYRTVDGNVLRPKDWLPVMIYGDPQDAKQSGATIEMRRRSYAPLAVLEYGGPDELEARVRSEGGVWTARRERTSGVTRIRLEHHWTDGRSLETWWLDSARGNVVTQSESVVYGSPELYGPNAVTRTSTSVNRATELKPGLWVPIEWRTHMHLEGFEKLVRIPGGFKDVDAIFVVSEIDANPVLDPSMFRVVRKQAAVGHKLGSGNR